MDWKLLVISQILFWGTFQILLSQDARLYYEGTYFNGPFINLNRGQTKYVVSDGDEISIKIYSPNVALKVSTINHSNNYYTTERFPYSFFIYTEKDFPEVFGTDQYEHQSLKVECISKAESINQMPQPLAFIPFDYSNAHPNKDNDHHLKPLKPNRRMLVLRKAYFWENSEDIGGWHGPYGDIKIGAYKPSVSNYEDRVLVSNPSLYSSQFLSQSELPGPIWSGYAPALYPDPYDEWIDGPFGCIYSNISVHDWGGKQSYNKNKRIVVIVEEADSPNFYMGKSRVISPEEDGLILVKVWGYGWVALENIDVNEFGHEENVDKADIYWLGGWNGNYPEHPKGKPGVYNPSWAGSPNLSNPAIPEQHDPGKQFRPFTDDQYWQFHDDPRFKYYKIGLLGGRFPKGTYDKPKIYYAIDTPAIFGKK